MNKVYLHSKNDETKIIKIVLMLLIPFIMYGFYKNGILLYSKHYISLLSMFKPLVFVASSVGISFIFKIIYKEKILSYRLFMNILVSMTISINTNMLFFIPALLLVNFGYKYYSHNMICSFMLLELLYLFIFKDYSFYNVIEKSIVHNYSLFDFLIGKSSGGISNSLIIMSIISLIILCTNFNYKKHIPIVSLITFYTLITMMALITSKVDISLFLNSNLLFALVFIAPISIFTPYTKGGAYIFGLLLGLLCFIFSFLDITLGVYLSILILNFISPLLDKFVTKERKSNV